MVEIDIIAFLKAGVVRSLNLGDDEVVILNKLGAPQEIESYQPQSRKFLHYGNVRFSINDGRLEGIDVFFINHDIVYRVEDDNLNSKLPCVDKGISLHQMLWLCQYLDQSYSFDLSDRDYFKITINKKVTIIYYIYTGELERVSYWQLF